MPSQQPPDEWTYLRPEEFADDDAVERVDDQFELGAEDAALHLVDLDEPQVSREALDPGETLPRGVAASTSETQFFEDEEPDSDRSTVATDDVGEEPRLDEILASQHYTFEEDGR